MLLAYCHQQERFTRDSSQHKPKLPNTCLGYLSLSDDIQIEMDDNKWTETSEQETKKFWTIFSWIQSKLIEGWWDFVSINHIKKNGQRICIIDITFQK